jgi:alanyl-tRNA synthetase
LPENAHNEVMAVIDSGRRGNIEKNHTVTHLMHAALRTVLGTHVQQKGSLVKDDSMRFDFSHFSKMTDEEITKVEEIVNEKIRQNIPLTEDRRISIEVAKEKGAMMLFGEKYGDYVRMITFDPTYSRELCGGCHVKATGEIGYFKIISESAIAAGVRRVEVLTGKAVESYINAHLKELDLIKAVFKSPLNTVMQLEQLVEENKQLRKDLEKLQSENLMSKQNDFVNSAITSSKGFKYVVQTLENVDGKIAKTLAYNILGTLQDAVVVFALKEDEKATLMVAASESLTKSHHIHAGNLVKNAAPLIGGGGGGQAFFATAGGKNVNGIKDALDKIIEELI